MSLCTRTWALRAGLAALIGLAQLIVGGAHAQYVQYLHTDALGSPVTVTDQSRGIVERNEYEPYGKVLGAPVQDGPGYTGHVSDAATGLSYMQQRYYDPQLGVFLSVDPGSDLGWTAFSRYAYAGDNPFLFIDPDGRQERPRTDFTSITSHPSVLPSSGGAPVTSGSSSADTQSQPVERTWFDKNFGERNLFTGTGSLTDFEALAHDVGIPLLDSPDGVFFKAGGLLAVRLGAVGEDAVRAAFQIGGRGIFTVGWRVRIADGMTATTISEVKNVGRQSYTRQIRDYVEYARSTGREFHLFVRPDTKLSGPLVEAIKAGDIKLNLIP